MKNIYCPNCGTKQPSINSDSGEYKIVCVGCKKTLTVKKTDGKIGIEVPGAMPNFGKD